MGLNSEHPPDPSARVELYANRALATIKQELIGAVILGLEQGEARYSRGTQAPPRRLWSERGAVFLQVGEQAPASLHPLGAEGALTFEIANTMLTCEILAREGPGIEKLLRTQLQIKHFEGRTDHD